MNRFQIIKSEVIELINIKSKMSKDQTKIEKKFKHVFPNQKKNESDRERKIERSEI